MLRNVDQVSLTKPLIGCLTYQSKASTPPTPTELDALIERARKRNHKHNVTGMLLYEDGRYLQTLEGPPEGLNRIWSSVQRDDCHQDIEVLSQHYVPSRLFSDWDLLLYRKREETPTSLLDRLRGKTPLAQHVPRVVKFALDADEVKLNDMFARLSEKGWDGDAIVRDLLEPAARAMGDAWLADECSEFDLTLGLGMLSMAGHAVRYSRGPDDLRTSQYTILLVSAPGEAHMFGPSLLADQFTDAGWAVEMAFPKSDEALSNQLQAQKPDAVDIALSDALLREGKVAQLRETVRQSRRSISEQPLVVSVGGRLFAEAVATAEHVGADHARGTLAGTRLNLRHLVEATRAARSDTDSIESKSARMDTGEGEAE
ncbi:MAG: BLUF domain-containing protein [Pseudomonadota bacterium]